MQNVHFRFPSAARKSHLLKFSNANLRERPLQVYEWNRAETWRNLFFFLLNYFLAQMVDTRFVGWQAFPATPRSWFSRRHLSMDYLRSLRTVGRYLPKEKKQSKAKDKKKEKKLKKSISNGSGGTKGKKGLVIKKRPFQLNLQLFKELCVGEYRCIFFKRRNKLRISRFHWH